MRCIALELLFSGTVDFFFFNWKLWKFLTQKKDLTLKWSKEWTHYTATLKKIFSLTTRWGGQHRQNIIYRTTRLFFHRSWGWLRHERDKKKMQLKGQYQLVILGCGSQLHALWHSQNFNWYPLSDCPLIITKTTQKAFFLLSVGNEEGRKSSSHDRMEIYFFFCSFKTRIFRLLILCFIGKTCR